MNDNTMIKVLYAIRFSISSFILFIILVLISFYIILQNGLLLDEVAIQNVKIKQLYIKWDEKIDLSIKEIDIKKDSTSQTKLEIDKIDNYIDYLSKSFQWFDSIAIEKMKFNNLHASFFYKQNEKGYFKASSPQFTLKSHIYFKDNLLNIDIDKLQNIQKNILLKAHLIFDAKDVKLSSKIHLIITDALETDIKIDLDKNKLHYKLQNTKEIKNTHNIISLLQLPKEVKYWVSDAIEMSYLSVEKAEGFIDFKKPEDALKNLFIDATVHKLDYTYHPKLDAIHTQYTKLEFSHGILYIKPHKAYSYGMFLDKSWLKIDFTKPEELLTLKLLFNGKVNKDILKILSTYQIDLPFLQKSGRVKTNLTIDVGLRNIDVQAHGTFFTKKANFNYLGLNIDIYNALIKLDNYDVSINKMKAKYKDIATATVDVKYNAHNAIGQVRFLAKKIQTKGVALISDKKPIIINYNINPKGDSIDVVQTQWIYKKKVFSLEQLHIPFDLEKLTIDLPTTFFQVKNIVDGYITGTIDLKHNEVNLLADILHLNYFNIKLSQSNAQIKMHYKDKIRFITKDTIYLNILDTNVVLKNMLVEIDEKGVNIKHTNIDVDGTVQAIISARHRFKEDTNIVRVKKLKIFNKKTKELLYKKSRLILDIQDKNNTITINSREIDSNFILNSKGWFLYLNSLNTLSRGSKLLHDLYLRKGKIKLSKKFNENSIKFTIKLPYKYKILSQNNKTISLYKIKGKFTKKQIFLSINGIAKIKIEDKIDIKLKNAGINITPLLKLIEIISAQSTKKNNTELTLSALDCTLNMESKNQILADTINLQYLNNETTAQLKYKSGNAGFKLKENTFHLYGKNFNDLFMDKLFRLSKFKGGSLDFSINGTLQKYKGVFYINKTTIIDYKLLNNVLAFINTVPSLITFSVPGYSKNGLFVDSAYMQFNANQGVFHISDFFLDSKEIDIIAKGKADIKKDTVDVTLNLKTDLGSSASKIPIVGYILFDDKSISTTMSITGKLSDPDVSSMLAKEIVVAPLNIIKRTLLYPYELLRSKENNETKK